MTVAFSDGTPSQNMTVGSGNSANYELEIGNGVHVTITWNSGSWDSECSYVVKYEDGTIILQNGATGGQFDVNCTGGSGTEVAPVTNLVGTLNGGSVTLTWNASADAVEYIVLRNGIPLDFTTETSFVDEAPTADVCTYCVLALDAEENASMPVCTEVTNVLDVEEAEVEFSIYPNPVNNTLYINGGSQYSYVMYNGMGQQVAAGEASGSHSINVSSIAQGVYFIRLTNGAQVSVQKVVVK